VGLYLNLKAYVSQTLNSIMWKITLQCSAEMNLTVLKFIGILYSLLM
jgi:hypothetical protein